MITWTPSLFLRCFEGMYLDSLCFPIGVSPGDFDMSVRWCLSDVRQVRQVHVTIVCFSYDVSARRDKSPLPVMSPQGDYVCFP